MWLETVFQIYANTDGRSEDVEVLHVQTIFHS